MIKVRKANNTDEKGAIQTKIYLINSKEKQWGKKPLAVYKSVLLAKSRLGELKKIFPQLKAELEAFDSYVPDVWIRECPPKNNADITKMMITKDGDEDED